MDTGRGQASRRAHRRSKAERRLEIAGGRERGSLDQSSHCGTRPAGRALHQAQDMSDNAVATGEEKFWALSRQIDTIARVGPIDIQCPYCGGITSPGKTFCCET